MGSGRFRCLSKPFKKWAFAKGVQFTQIFSQQFINKYLLKFLRKHAKTADTSVCIAGRSEHRESIALAVRMTDILLNGQCGKPASGEVAELRHEELRASLRGAINASLMGQGDCEAQADATKGVEAETLSPLRLIRSSTCLNAQPREEWANELVDFAMGLGEAVDKNVGLDHSKVREYWLQRGPRWLITAIVFFVFTVVCQEMLKSQKEASNDRFYTLSVNAVAFIIATVMLYFRLPDSIEASISRAAHDFYVDYKRRMGNYKRHHAPAVELHESQWRSFGLFDKLSEAQLNKTVSRMVVKNYHVGDKILSKGTIGTTVICICVCICRPFASLLACPQILRLYKLGVSSD